ncbi:MAG: hypothetical protein IT443_13390 [Phycisphaeraceae bacterium]|nr:hypothetical protein [Phycisphaeraceae bacterium]
MTAINAVGTYRTATTATPRIIRPGRSSVRTTYQLAADIDIPSEASVDAVFSRAAAVVMNWLDEKLPQTLPKSARNLENFDMDHHGQQQVSGVSIGDHGLWSVRLIQPDAPFKRRLAVAGRTWTTELSLHKSDVGVRFAVRVLCASAPYAIEPIALTRPRVVIDLAQEFGLREIRPLDGRPWMLSTEEDLESLYELVVSDNRTMPIVLLTEPDHRQWQIKFSAYVIDETDLSRRTQAMAHVVCMPKDLGFRWTERVGKIWSAFHGAIRTYYPKVHFEEDSPSSHPLMMLERVVFWRRNGEAGEAAFASFLSEKIAEHAAVKPLDWGQCLFFADARARRAEIAREQINLVIQQQAQTDESSTLRTQIESLQQAHKEEVEALKAKLTEAQKDVEEFDDLSSQYKTEVERVARENRSLQSQNDALRLAIEKKTGKSADATVVIPTTYDDMPDWVDHQLAGRLVFHPRAVQGVKKANYEDIELVYHSLLLLAGEYRNMRLGHDGAQKAWDAGLTRLGLRFDKSISKERAGEQGETYFVRYPLGSTQRQFLELHLRKGTTKDDRYCLGIYYFFDEDTSQVVVGWLTNHLDTRAT